MAEKNLIQLIKCRELLISKNFLAKLSFNRIFDQISTIVVDQIKLIGNQVLGNIESVVKDVGTIVDKAVNTFDVLEARYRVLKNSKFSFTKILDSFGVDISCPESLPIGGENPLAPTVNITAEAFALPPTQKINSSTLMSTNPGGSGKRPTVVLPTFRKSIDIIPPRLL